MADSTESSTVVAAAPARVLEVIADFEAYPQWAGDVKQAEVLSTDSDGRAEQVRFVLDAGAVKDTYTLAYDWSGVGSDGQGVLSWHLVEAGLLTAMDGSYELAADGEGTTVTYRLMVNLRIPMLGLLKRKAERVITDTALKQLTRRAQS